MIKRALAVAAIVLACPWPARAAAVVAVLSADRGVYRAAFDGLRAAFGADVPLRLAAADLALDPDTRVVVAIGGRAALHEYPSGVSVVYCLAPSMDVAAARWAAGRRARVRVVPKPAALIAKVKSLQPAARSVALLWSSAEYDEYASQVAAEGKHAGIEVLAHPVEPTEILRALPLLRGRAQAVWLAPDPLLVTPAAFRMIAAVTARAGIAFYAPSADLVQEGATAAIAVSPYDMGRAAAGAVRLALAGKPLPSDLYADPER